MANRCHHYVPARTGITKREKVSDEINNALRDETPLPTKKLEVLRTFTLQVRDSQDRPGDDPIAAFFAAGFDERAILYVILIYAQKVMSNFSNAMFETPADAAFEKFLWQPKKAVAAE